jgi:hypothetical protein
VLGPCLTAAFYRVAAVRDAGGGLTRAISADLADVDLALALQQAGYRAVFESRSQVYAQSLIEPPASAFLRGLYAERMFWRNIGAVGWVRSLVAHPAYVMGSFASNILSRGAVSALVGRFLACCQLGHYRQHRRVIAVSNQARRPDQDGRAMLNRRIDAAHPTGHAASAGNVRAANANS